MNSMSLGRNKFMNGESPFTELFSLLKRYENLSDGGVMLAYQSDNLQIMHQHIDNAIEVLLHGLQSLGFLMGASKQDKKAIMEELSNIGFFISAITNLTEALNILRSDTDYVLHKRGVDNF